MGHEYIKQLPNGLTLLGEHNEAVSSAAMTLLLPGGGAYDPADLGGAASVAAEWRFRGAGERDTRQLNDALDSLGCHHGEAVQSAHVGLSTVQLGRNLADVLEIYADIVLRPRLDDETFSPCRDLVAQDLASLEDEPARKANMLVRENFYPYPLGRSVYGMAESLERMTADAIRSHASKHCSPAGAILSVAGNINWPQICELVDKHFGDWQAGPVEPIETIAPRGGVTHIAKDSAQVHISLAHKAVPIIDERYYAARMGEAVLSWGMGCRLFTEVREKRGLVYHVSSRYSSLKDHAGMFTYAGTRPDVAQETLDVTIGELRRLGDGIEADELARAKTQLKSALVMQGESTSARAGALAGDFYHLGRIRTLAEISEAVDAVTVDEVLAYLADMPAENFTMMVIGPEPLKISSK